MANATHQNTQKISYLKPHYENPNNQFRHGKKPEPRKRDSICITELALFYGGPLCYYCCTGDDKGDGIELKGSDKHKLEGVVPAEAIQESLVAEQLSNNPVTGRYMPRPIAEGEVSDDMRELFDYSGGRQTVCRSLSSNGAQLEGLCGLHNDGLKPWCCGEGRCNYAIWAYRIAEKLGGVELLAEKLHGLNLVERFQKIGQLAKEYKCF